MYIYIYVYIRIYIYSALLWDAAVILNQKLIFYVINIRFFASSHKIRQLNNYTGNHQHLVVLP